MPFLRQHISDLVAYVLLPLAALVLPAAVSRSMVHRVANWGWMLPDGDRALAAASRQVTITDAASWLRHWRRVELLDARDCFLLRFGRSGAVFSEIEGLDSLARADGLVLVGMHWGPSLCILRLLSAHGMTPTLVYRKVDAGLKWKRPFQYLHLRVTVSEIERACGGTAIAAGGAKRRLQERLQAPGIIIVLADAPAQAGRPVLEGRLLGQRCRFNAGFPGLLLESGRAFAFYAISLTPDGRVRKRLDIDGPHQADTHGAFMERYCGFLQAHLEEDSAQWRIWQVAGQLFPGEADGEVPQEGATAPDTGTTTPLA